MRTPSARIASNQLQNLSLMLTFVKRYSSNTRYPQEPKSWLRVHFYRAERRNKKLIPQLNFCCAGVISNRNKINHCFVLHGFIRQHTNSSNVCQSLRLFGGWVGKPENYISLEINPKRSAGNQNFLKTFIFHRENLALKIRTFVLIIIIIAVFATIFTTVHLILEECWHIESLGK